MALVMTPIYTQTVGAGGFTGYISFNNIPQIYTDLKLILSMRTNAAAIFEYVGISLNNGTAAEIIRLQGTGGSVNSSRAAGGNSFITNGNNATANTFGSAEIYIPNYTSTNPKQMIIDTVTETNGSTAYQELCAAYYAQGGNPTTAISIGSNTFLQHSTFSLYGIIRQGA